MHTPSTDYIYWTFSAASQSVAAFVAFLLTGYALVINLMESARARDDSLEELHASLRTSYHERMAWLAGLTGLAIVSSLVIVFFNRPESPASAWLYLPVALVDVTAVIAGIAFVVSIVHPKKYERAAQKAFAQESRTGSDTSPSGKFFEAFIHLESSIRDYLRKRDLYEANGDASRLSITFRQMLDTLWRNERISSDFYSELQTINKYRNLVFHGHVNDVDAKMVQRVKNAAQHIERLF